MMKNKNLPNFEYYYKKGSDTLDIVLQGGNYGIDTPFMRNLIKTLREGDNSVLAFNFLYYERGEDHSSGEELLEELKTLREMMDFVHDNEFKHIRLVAKSLGGIVGSFYLDRLTPSQMKKYSIVILGYVTGSVRLSKFSGPITVIQGEKDKFGDVNKVKIDLEDAKSKKIQYFQIKGADHSFRDPDTKEPKYEDDAINILASLLE